MRNENAPQSIQKRTGAHDKAKGLKWLTSYKFANGVVNNYRQNKAIYLEVA